ncbi:MAG TPA: DUF4258 domain-containing protein [Chitinophaga sp.]|nr:DUF4258 domain-containing protein [Chitinophaga sp.]
MKSKGKYIPMLLLAVLLWLAWQQQWWKGPGRPDQSRTHNNSTTTVRRTPVSGPAALNRHSPLRFTRHARCRMECRHITEAEVAEILEFGTLNTEKSNPMDEPCPTYALEGYSEEGQHLRVVFAPCGNEDSIRVVTCIDLDKEWSCSCN